MSDSMLNRRRFLQLAAASAASVSLASLVASGTAVAAETLSPTDPAAVALGYVEKAESTKDATYKKGSACHNCVLYQAAQEAGGHAPCGAFGGKLVAAGGWCKAFAAKPA